jgi:hypothetical protein
MSFYISVTLHCTVKEKGGKPDRKPDRKPYPLRNPYRNLKSENSQDYAQNFQASGQIFKDDLNGFFLHLGYLIHSYSLREITIHSLLLNRLDCREDFQDQWKLSVLGKYCMHCICIFCTRLFSLFSREEQANQTTV